MFHRKLVLSGLMLVATAVQAAPARQGPKPAPATRRPSTTAGAPAAAASTRVAPASDVRRPWVAVSGGPGFPFARGPIWVRGQLSVGIPVMRVNERLDLSLALPLSVGRAKETGAFLAESSVLALDLVPSARLDVRGPGRWGFHGAFGVGAAHFRYGFRIPELGETRGSTTGLAFRAAAGVDYRVGRSLQLFLEPLNLLFHTAQEGVFRFGNTSFTSSTGAGSQASVLAGAAYSW